MKETIQKRLSGFEDRHCWTCLVYRFVYHDVWLFSDGCDVTVGNLLTTKGRVVYFTDDTSMPADSLVAKVELLSSEECFQIRC